MLEVFYILATTHITIMCVTLFLHRSQAHKTLEFHPIVSHLMRFWLWLTTGMVTKQWVAIHRKHHRFSDQNGDPHSPHVYGILAVIFKGTLLYHEASKDKDMVSTYGVGTPDDWVERNVYSTHSRAGIAALFIFNVWLLGWFGIIAWLVQMIWIPFWAAGVVNGLGHFVGYRNGKTKDKSRNLFPLGVIIGGEELHNNHHLDPSSAKLSRKWFEFDVGWLYIVMLRSIGLVKVKEY